jgi:hypothetical protein
VGNVRDTIDGQAAGSADGRQPINVVAIVVTASLLARRVPETRHAKPNAVLRWL